jgi:hypothetical protein
MISQCNAMLEYMAKHGTITTREATRDLGIMSPTRRITDLQAMGWRIESQWINVKSRYGNGKAKVKQYYIKTR